MKAIYGINTYGHRPEFQCWDGKLSPHPESPARAESILKGLKRIGVPVVEPDFGPDFDSKEVTRRIEQAHSRMLVDFVTANRQNAIVFDGPAIHGVISEADEAIPVCPGTELAARTAVASAIYGAKTLVKGDEGRVYALCRPPGHHASRDSAGGYCYFNSMAIAAMMLAEHGKAAILDLDLHHGNGTQDIVMGRPGMLFVSMNGIDTYPGITSGRQSRDMNANNVANYNADPAKGEEGYAALLCDALDRIKSFDPDALVVSLGTDTAADDWDVDGVESRVRLSRPFFYRMGLAVAGLYKPVLVGQEGGYNPETLGDNVAEFLAGVNDLPVKRPA
jgi:acetoin utilization deacetylase AcuC-like enzyme